MHALSLKAYTYMLCIIVNFKLNKPTNSQVIMHWVGKHTLRCEFSSNFYGFVFKILIVPKPIVRNRSAESRNIYTFIYMYICILWAFTLADCHFKSLVFI